MTTAQRMERQFFISFIELVNEVQSAKTTLPSQAKSYKKSSWVKQVQNPRQKKDALSQVWFLIHSQQTTMTLTNPQLDKIVEIYATALVDSMDEKMLENCVYETIVENMSTASEEEILNQLYAYYDEQDADKIVESVSSL